MEGTTTAPDTEVALRLAAAAVHLAYAAAGREDTDTAIPAALALIAGALKHAGGHQ